MPKNTESAETIGLPPGTKVGKYEIIERSAMGGQAVVYKAYDPLLDRHVAIKQISSHLADDPQFMDRFRKEAQILAKLGAEQPCIVTIHDLIQDPQGLFIVMEFIEGNSLATIIAETNGPTENKAALQVLWRLAGALHAVHSAGIIHRDIKPGNVIISDGLWPTIMDFGVAASISGQTSMVLGTTRYMAPELFNGGAVDGRADMYSLGFVMYELLAGKPKFDEIFAEVIRDKRTATMRWMKWHGNAAVQAPLLHKVNPGIPVPLSHIVARMIAKDPDERFESMESLGKAIKGAFSSRGRGGRTSVAPPPSAISAAADGQGRSAIDGGLDLDGDEPTFDPEPTARLPKSTLSLRTKLILLGTVLAGVLALVITVSVKNAEKRRVFQAKVDTLYKPVGESYDKRQWAKVVDSFTEMKKAVDNDREDGAAIEHTVQMAKAIVMVRLAEGHVAVAKKERDWLAAAFRASRECKKAREFAESEYAKTMEGKDVHEFDKWLEDVRGDLREFEEEHLAVRSYQEILQRVIAARTSKQYQTALTLISDETLKEKNLRLTPEQNLEIQALRTEIRQEQFMDKFRVMATRAEDIYQGGKGNLPKAKIEFERALAFISSDEAKEIVPQDKSDEIVGQLKGKISAINTSLKETRLLAAWDDAIKDNDPLAIKRAAEDLIRFDPAHARNAGLRAKVDAVMGTKERAEFIAWVRANRATKPNECVVRIKQWIIAHPDEPAGSEIRTTLAQLEKGMSLAARVRQAKGTYRDGKWAAAIPLLQALLKESPTSTGLERTEIRAWIKECQLQILWAKAGDLRAKGQYREATATYKNILEIDKTWKREAILRIVDEITQRVSYEHALDQAKNAFKSKQYNDAISWAKRVLDIKRTSVDALRIVTDSRYEQQMAQGRAQMEKREYAGAKAYFTVAYGIKKTDEAKDLIDQMKKKISGTP